MITLKYPMETSATVAIVVAMLSFTAAKMVGYILITPVLFFVAVGVAVSWDNVGLKYRKPGWLNVACAAALLFSYLYVYLVKGGDGEFLNVVNGVSAGLVAVSLLHRYAKASEVHSFG